MGNKAWLYVGKISNGTLLSLHGEQGLALRRENNIPSQPKEVREPPEPKMSHSYKESIKGLYEFWKASKIGFSGPRPRGWPGQARGRLKLTTVLYIGHVGQI